MIDVGVVVLSDGDWSQMKWRLSACLIAVYNRPICVKYKQFIQIQGFGSLPQQEEVLLNGQNAVQESRFPSWL